MAAADTTTTADAAAADSGEEFTVTPYMKHVPDSYTELEAAQGASWELGAGHYELGFEVDGARIPILKLKGGGVAK